MQYTRRQNLVLLTAAVAATTLPARYARAQGETHEVQMLNAHPDDRRRAMVFHPAVLHVQPGDTVRFVPTDRGHNAQSVDGMTPEGAEPFRGRINEEIEVTFDVEGTYGHLCQPHQTMGMLGLVLVGDFTANLDAVRDAAGNLRGRASAARFEEYLAEVDQIATEEGLT